MAKLIYAWQAADKVVYPSTLAAPDREHSARTPLLSGGGPKLTAQALVAGLVDELALFVWPVVLGGRTPALPTDMRVDLKLIDEHRFSTGVVHLRYRLP